MKKSLLFLLLFSVSCTGSLQHGLVVTSSTGHSVLNLLETTVDLTTCDKLPSLPHCITVAQRKELADKFIKAYQLDKTVATDLKNWDGKGPTPANITGLVTDLSNLVNEIKSAIPESEPKNVLNAQLGVK